MSCCTWQVFVIAVRTACWCNLSNSRHGLINDFPKQTRVPAETGISHAQPTSETIQWENCSWKIVNNFWEMKLWKINVSGKRREVCEKKRGKLSWMKIKMTAVAYKCCKTNAFPFYCRTIKNNLKPPLMTWGETLLPTLSDSEESFLLWDLVENAKRGTAEN